MFYTKYYFQKAVSLLFKFGCSGTICLCTVRLRSTRCIHAEYLKQRIMEVVATETPEMLAKSQM